MEAIDTLGKVNIEKQASLTEPHGALSRVTFFGRTACLSRGARVASIRATTTVFCVASKNMNFDQLVSYRSCRPIIIWCILDWKTSKTGVNKNRHLIAVGTSSPWSVDLNLSPKKFQFGWWMTKANTWALPMLKTPPQEKQDLFAHMDGLKRVWVTKSNDHEHWAHS